MQWFYNNRDTVLIKYILPVVLAFLLAFGICLSAVVRAEAILPAALPVILVGDFLLGLASGYLEDIILNGVDGSDDVMPSYQAYVNQLPYPSVCKYGYCIPITVSGVNGLTADQWSVNGNTVGFSVPYNSRYPNCREIQFDFNDFVSPCQGTVWFPGRYRSNIPKNDNAYYEHTGFYLYWDYHMLSGGSVEVSAGQVLSNSGNFQFCLRGYPAENTFWKFSFLSCLYFQPDTVEAIDPTGYRADTTSRLGSIAGNYLYQHNNFDAADPDTYDVYRNVALVDETALTYHNPVTNTTKTITDWQYDYAGMSYTLTLDDDSTVAVTWGNEYCSIIDGGTTYCLYYLPADFAEDKPCTHDWDITDTMNPTCAMAGYNEMTCSKCGETKIEKIDPLGHDWLLSEHVTVDGTETETTWGDWTQPALTSNTSYGTVSASVEGPNGAAWRALDGLKAAAGQSWESAQNSYPAWWQWHLPVTLSISHLKLTNKYSGSAYLSKDVSVYSDAAHTNLIASGEFPQSSFSTLEWDFETPVETDTLYIVCENSWAASNSYVGLGEVEITAQQQTIVDTSVDNGYDLYKCSRCGAEYRDYTGAGVDAGTGDSNFFKGLGNLIKRAIDWVLGKLTQLVQGLNSIIGIFKGFVEEVKSVTSGFTSFLGGVFEAIPAPLGTLLWFSIIAAVVVGVITKIFR